MPDMLTQELLHQALRNLEPTIRAEFFGNPDKVWGPNYFAVAVMAPHLNSPIFSVVPDPDQDWNPEWGDASQFMEIAHWKVQKAYEYGLSTAEIVENYPLLLADGDYLYAGGIIDATGNIAVAVSGLRGTADHEVAILILEELERLAIEKVAAMNAAGQGRM